MAGNSKRKGAIKKTGKGNPTAGSGGRVRRGLEGRGPTPKAKDRPYHQAHKAAKRAEKAKETRPKRRTSSDAEWAAGRNSVVELLQAGVPVSAIYVAEGAERDGRMREAFKLAAEPRPDPARGHPQRDGPDDQRRGPPGPRGPAARATTTPTPTTCSIVPPS